MSAMIIVVAGLAALAVLFIFASMALSAAPADVDLLESRLAQFNEAGRPIANLTEAELTLPFYERAIRPTFDRISRRLASRQGAARTQAIQERINLAGRPMGLTVGGLLSLQLIGAVVLGVVVFLLAELLGLTGTMLLLAPAVGLMLGYMLPQSMLSRAARKRQKQILVALPSALDLLTISVEAGLGFDAALSRLVDKYRNALSLEFNQVLNEVRLGRPRLEALDDLGRRCGVEELNNFVQAVIQSEQLGVGIANVLRIQSEEIRRRRRQRAEEQGQKAPLLMLFPMVGCIFPTLFIVLLGPAVIQITKSAFH